MSVELPVIDLIRFKTPPDACPYLPSEIASLEYRRLAGVTGRAYQELLRRGWRRFGHDFFRPACPQCRKCRSLRIDVGEFNPSRTTPVHFLQTVDREALWRRRELRVELGERLRSPLLGPVHQDADRLGTLDGFSRTSAPNASR